MKKINAFTLAEIMIVLCVIGILTAVLLPAARNIMPNEDVIKFKKAHNTLTSVVRELVTSDKYYKDGMLNKKADAAGSAVGASYFCESFADMLNVKSKRCADTSAATGSLGATDYASYDTACRATNAKGANIELADGVKFFQANTSTDFSTTKDATTGFYSTYKVFCLDLDGDGSVPAFGYGVRVDGKVVLGSEAQTWLNRSIQEKE